VAIATFLPLRISVGIDPVLAGPLRDAARNTPGFDLESVASASAGLRIWQDVLQKGRLPTAADFAGEGCGLTWPEDPLFSRFIRVLADLQLPRFVLRHPDTAPAVLLSMLQLTIDFIEESQAALDQQVDPNLPPISDAAEDTDSRQDEADAEEPMPAEGLEALADELANELVLQWGGVIGGVQNLDTLFGAQHGLFDVAGIGGGGFGLHDGIWRHSGWRALPQLQRQLSAIPEMRVLMSQLGRRPSARGTTINRFAPQMPSRDSTMGVQNDPIARTSVNGLTLSSSLTEMLPSEAVLLKSASPTLRRLFLAKKVEAKLLSYELSGWIVAPSIPRRRASHLPRLPSAAGVLMYVCVPPFASHLFLPLFTSPIFSRNPPPPLSRGTFFFCLVTLWSVSGVLMYVRVHSSASHLSTPSPPLSCFLTQLPLRRTLGFVFGHVVVHEWCTRKPG